MACVLGRAHSGWRHNTTWVVGLILVRVPLKGQATCLLARPCPALASPLTALAFWPHRSSHRPPPSPPSHNICGQTHPTTPPLAWAYQEFSRTSSKLVDLLTRALPHRKTTCHRVPLAIRHRNTRTGHPKPPSHNPSLRIAIKKNKKNIEWLFKYMWPWYSRRL